MLLFQAQPPPFKAERKAVNPVTIWSATFAQNPNGRVRSTTPVLTNRKPPFARDRTCRCNRELAGFFSTLSGDSLNPCHRRLRKSRPTRRVNRDSRTTKKIRLDRNGIGSAICLDARLILGTVHARRLRSITSREVGCTIDHRVQGNSVVRGDFIFRFYTSLFFSF